MTAQAAPPPSKYENKFPTPPPLVPEIGSDEAGTFPDENVEHFRVPIFDPFLDEFGMEYDAKPLHEELCDLDSFTGFLPSDMDLAEFAADVESYLGAGVEDDIDACFGDQKMKLKQEEVETDSRFLQDMAKESLPWKLDEEEHEEKMAAAAAVEMRRKVSLSLNYENVITAWASQGSPWKTGNRPEFDPNDYLLDKMVIN